MGRGRRRPDRVNRGASQSVDDLGRQRNVPDAVALRRQDVARDHRTADGDGRVHEIYGLASEPGELAEPEARFGAPSGSRCGARPIRCGVERRSIAGSELSLVSRKWHATIHAWLGPRPLCHMRDASTVHSEAKERAGDACLRPDIAIFCGSATMSGGYSCVKVSAPALRTRQASGY